MIAIGRQFRYIAQRGKLSRRWGELVTVLSVQKWQIRVRFADGKTAHIHPRFLQQISKP